MPLLAPKKGLFRGSIFHSNQRPRPIHPGNPGKMSVLQLQQDWSIPHKESIYSPQGDARHNSGVRSPDSGQIDWKSEWMDVELDQQLPQLSFVSNPPQDCHRPQLFPPTPTFSPVFANLLRLLFQRCEPSSSILAHGGGEVFRFSEKCFPVPAKLTTHRWRGVGSHRDLKARDKQRWSFWKVSPPKENWDWPFYSYAGTDQALAFFSLNKISNRCSKYHLICKISKYIYEIYHTVS